VSIAKQKEKAKPAANLAFMMVPPLELFPEHLPCQTEVQIVTEQRECPAMRFLDDRRRSQKKKGKILSIFPFAPKESDLPV
jgi:hypothetical protein